MFEILLFILFLMILGMIGQDNPHKKDPKWSDREYRNTCRNHEENP
jgi:hypothetical protein